MKSVLIGYAQNNKAYRLLDDESGVVVESRDVEFFEDKFSRYNENSNSTTPTSTSRGILAPPPIVEIPIKSCNVPNKRPKNFISKLINKYPKNIIIKIQIKLMYQSSYHIRVNYENAE